jgi:probable HAF family extracellular repeat protein
MVALNDSPGNVLSWAASGVSADGSVIVGVADDALGFDQAFRWTNATGTVSLGIQPNAQFSVSNAVSEDGATVVGFSFGAFRWTTGTGMVNLGFRTAADVSADGSVVVGYRIGLPDEAVLWTAAGGIQGLGHLTPESTRSEAWSVSADGSVIGGYDANNSDGHAFIWRQATGMLNLRDYLIANGVSGLDGWELNIVHAMSADGRTFVGGGTNPDGFSEGWIATIPEPSTWILAALGLIGLVSVQLARLKKRRRQVPQ